MGLSDLLANDSQQSDVSPIKDIALALLHKTISL